MTWRLLIRSLPAMLVALGLLSAPVAASGDTAPPNPARPPTVSADPLPTAQIDGVVWSQVVVGDTVYAGGKFTTARPAGSAPGVNTTPRNNLLAFNIRTGNLVTTFAPNLNGQVLGVAASPDGSRIYATGDFTVANGVNRYRIAAFDSTTGAVISSFKPTLDYHGRALVVTGTTVYVGGKFNSASGLARTNLAAFRASDGAVLPWAPAASAEVMAMVMTPNGTKIIAGGRFTTLSGVAAYGMGALDSSSGAILPWAATQVVRNAGTQAAILSLSASATRIYGTGYVFGSGGNFEGTFGADPTTGQIVWLEDCHGDTYSSVELGAVVYSVSHNHYCGNIPDGYPESNPRSHHHMSAYTTAVVGTVTKDTQGYANFAGQPAPAYLFLEPGFQIGTFTGQNQAGWNVVGTSEYAVIGGEFPKVGASNQQGLVRFAISTIAPNKRGAVDLGANFVPTLTKPQAATVRVSWTANWDRDNELLTYRVIRNGNTASPLYQTTALSTWWRRPALSFNDTTVVAGQTYRYRIQVTDPFGNSVLGNEVSITA
jgi:hypothetical protein